MRAIHAEKSLAEYSTTDGAAALVRKAYAHHSAGQLSPGLGRISRLFPHVLSAPALFPLERALFLVDGHL